MLLNNNHTREIDRSNGISHYVNLEIVMHYAQFASKQAAVDFGKQIASEGYLSIRVKFSTYLYEVRYWK